MMRALLLAAGSSLAYAQCGPPSETCGLYFAEVRPSLPIAELSYRDPAVLLTDWRLDPPW